MGALPKADPAMRPQLRNDVRFVESPDGAYVHSDYGACTVRGRQAYAWLARLAPALTGHHTLAELTAHLPGDRRAMVEGLVGRLAEQRFVVDARQAHAHGLSEEESREYAEEIAFVGYALDSPESRFARVRRERLVVMGSGPLLEALAGACAGTGWRHLTVISPVPDAAGRAAEAARRDPGQHFRTLAPAAFAPAAADVVLQVSADPGELVATARACEAAGVVLGQAFAGPGEVWLSQVGQPARTAAESGWHRLVAGRRFSADLDEDLLVGPVPAVVAAILALGCFSCVTGLDTGRERALTRVDLRTLDTLPHRFLPHPRAAARPGGGAEAPPSGDEAPSLDADALLALTADLVDARTGVLTTLDEQALAQSPLAVCQATVSDPFGVLPGWTPRPQAFGWGPDQRTARLRCLLAALATYGLLALGPEEEGTVWGVELPDGRPRAVPRTVLRLTASTPATDVPRPPSGTGTPRSPLGTGAGLSRSGALAAGLRSHCEHLLSTHLPPDAARTGTPITPEDDPAAEALLRQLVLAGEPPRIRDHTSVLGMPAVTLTTPAQETLVSVAATIPDALRDGLERLLLGWQSRTTRQPAYARATPLWPPDGDPSEAVRVMAGALRRAGKVPVAVPLGGDPEAARLLPFVTRVVLLDG
ncbi:hypothetical protein FXF51_59995 [Nonomuraea sp. PA05]|uniref:hypothetical protein n=1 Tax=Nonomuraea sp. PA05 TaxID=2604466 RepID=UPI0011DB5BC6|nr:hypothetical protein [Nonomuraea sp. PA05]TYB45786.1 hypothetical protein FXF51_59995 [Nonomuraea sp. PA05]